LQFQLQNNVSMLLKKKALRGPFFYKKIAFG